MILNIIDKIYENSNFKKYLIIAFIILILLLIIVYIIGKIEYKKKNSPAKNNEEDVKDITFDLPPEPTNIKEDVTFEMPVLTSNLEAFKKNLEEEIEKEEEINVRKTSGIKVEQETKTIKILDKDAIEDTSIVSLKNIELASENAERAKNKIDNAPNISKDRVIENSPNIATKRSDSSLYNLPKIKQNYANNLSQNSSSQKDMGTPNSANSVYDSSDDF